jgi:hypothetical protein
MSSDYRSDFSDLKPPTARALGALGMAAAMMAQQTDSILLYGTPQPPPEVLKRRSFRFHDAAADRQGQARIGEGRADDRAAAHLQGPHAGLQVRAL